MPLVVLAYRDGFSTSCSCTSHLHNILFSVSPPQVIVVEGNNCSDLTLMAIKIYGVRVALSFVCCSETTVNITSNIVERNSKHMYRVCIVYPKLYWPLYRYKISKTFIDLKIYFVSALCPQFRLSAWSDLIGSSVVHQVGFFVANNRMKSFYYITCVNHIHTLTLQC